MANSAMAKPQVVMVHGAGGGGWEYDFWRLVWEKAGFQVSTPDMMPRNNDYAQTTFTDYLTQTKNAAKNKRPLVLVGASMGGILVLRAAETLKPDAIVLINSTSPLGVNSPKGGNLLPPIVVWENGPIQDTRDSLPDGDEKTVQWAHPKWRNESGAVLNTIRAGVRANPPACPVLVVIGLEDTDIPPANSMNLAKWANADIHSYAGTSHIGPLMGLRRKEIAKAAVDWALASLKR
ncbi:MAG: alpha/beta hydrolase [Fimbriimonadaceae bacterium]|nr:MAG: alpha/beta hydrolase [Fimbriimonadaceae bacterium]